MKTELSKEELFIIIDSEYEQTKDHLEFDDWSTELRNFKKQCADYMSLRLMRNIDIDENVSDYISDIIMDYHNQKNYDSVRKLIEHYIDDFYSKINKL